MPRPKRSKVASKASAPAPSTRNAAVAPTHQLDIEMSQASESSVAPVLRRATRGNAAASVPVTKITAGHKRAMEQAQNRSDSAMTRLEAENDATSDNETAAAAANGGIVTRTSSSSPDVELGRRGRPMSDIESSAPMPNTGNFRRRAREGSILGPRRAVKRSVSVESELAQSQDITNIEREIPEVPMSAFRPRKRQGSILGRAGHGRDNSVEPEMGRESSMNTPARPGSAMGGNLSLFRRRVRQGSILGTPGGHGVGRESFLGATDDELDFAPEDESTPLNLPMSRAIPDAPEPSPAPAHATSSSNLRKRKISPVQHTYESSQPLPENPQVARSPSASSSLSLSPPPVPSPPHIQQRPQRSQTPEIPSSTFAPPHSSSSINLTPSPQRTGITQRVNHSTTSARAPPTRRQPRREAAAMSDDDLPSSPPSLSYSPDNRHVAAAKSKGRQTKAKPAPAMLSTAELQALLPRRKTRKPARTDRDIFDIESGEDEEDEDADELSMAAPSRPNANRRTPAAPNKRITKLKSAAKGKGTRSHDKKSTPEEADYASGKENEEDEDEEDHSLAPISDSIEEGESSILDGKVGKELKKAKEKFRDVDKWEMEFESVTAEGSSQADAR